MSNARAVRYRRLALIEQDNAKAKLLQLIADEADRGVLFTSEWLSKPSSLQNSSSSNKPADAKSVKSAAPLPDGIPA
jgi:hypothetical protein